MIEFRKLDKAETAEFQQWARTHYLLGMDINSAWHPVIVAECELMNSEQVGDSISEIITELKFADKLPISEGHINSLMDARDRLNELIAVSVHQMIDSRG